MDAEKDPKAEKAEPPAGETPSDDELDVEGPNESAPGHEPRSEAERAEERSSTERG